MWNSGQEMCTDSIFLLLTFYVAPYLPEPLLIHNFKNELKISGNQPIGVL